MGSYCLTDKIRLIDRIDEKLVNILPTHSKSPTHYCDWLNVWTFQKNKPITKSVWSVSIKECVASIHQHTNSQSKFPSQM